MKYQLALIATILASAFAQYSDVAPPVATGYSTSAPAPVSTGYTTSAPAPAPATYQAAPAPAPVTYQTAPTPVKPTRFKHLTAAEIKKIQKDLDGLCNQLTQLENQCPTLISHEDREAIQKILAQIGPLEKHYRELFAELPHGARKMRSWKLIEEAKEFIAKL